MEYQVMICTHDRPDGLAQNTLALLERLAVPLNRVTVFVTPANFDLYRAQLWMSGWTGKRVNVLPGDTGLGANRNFGMRYFPAGTPVLSFNDDIKDMKGMGDGGKWTPLTPDAFRSLTVMGFDLLEAWNGAVWGVCNLQNDLWARNLPDLQVGMPAVEGHFFGFIAGYEPLLVEDLVGEFEDIERGAQVFAAGKNVVKLNRFLHAQRKGKGSVGGHPQETCARVRQLERRYPRLVEHSVGRDAGKAPCRPWPIKGRWVNNPGSLDDLDRLRAKITAEPGWLLRDPTIHGE
jgi:hypothetical protein